MKLSIDEVAKKLQAELGADAVNNDPVLLSAYTIDGKKPGLWCSPATAEQVAAALRLCSEAEVAVTPWGGGTAMAIGNPPRQADLVLGLSRLNRVVEHDDANLTATVESGITLAGMQRALAPRNQFLPFDPPHAARSTVGGIVAANLNGPRRIFYGSVRDLVIGMKVALASGEQIKAGGKVVKNVAGYDMCKLFVGSLGTLGVITEITLRLMPVPKSSATLTASGTLSQTLQLAAEMGTSRLLPASVSILNPAAANASGLSPGKARAAVRFEGFEESVSRQLRDTRAIAGRIGLEADLLSAEAEEELWGYVRDVPLNADQLVYRLTLPPSSLAELTTTVSEWNSEGAPLRIVGDAAWGSLWLSAQPGNANIEWFTTLISLVRERGGHAVVFAAPASLKGAIDVWGAAPPTLPLMREIKRQFDPKDLLNPGRFVAGL
jgi:glycolate oxidase FAD binding subunit